MRYYFSWVLEGFKKAALTLAIHFEGWWEVCVQVRAREGCAGGGWWWCGAGGGADKKLTKKKELTRRFSIVSYAMVSACAK